MKFLKWLNRKDKRQSFCSAVIVAAGNASRMGGTDKIICELGGIPVIVRSLQFFQESQLIQEVIIVTRQEIMLEIGRLCKDYGLSKVTKIMPGGESRMESVQIGLCEVNATADLIAIHDGARPFLSKEVLENAVRQAELTGAAAPGIPVKDTIKLTEKGVIKRTLPRELLYAIQTPQVFEATLIKAAIAKAKEDGVAITDDCSAVERLGFPVIVTVGSEENIKLTTPNDLLLGEVILSGGAGLENWTRI